jgi:putative membrane protein
MARSRLPFLIALAPGAARAHDPGVGATVLAWSFEPWIVALLLASIALYVTGVNRLWRKAGRGRGIRVREAIFFGTGWIVLALALLSPVDTLGTELFSVHMVQHELLMVVAAPLFVLARPLEAWAWALPASWMSAMARGVRNGVLERAWRGLTDPVGAFAFHAAVLWGWHIPAAFAAAVLDDNLHTLQHSTFLVSALFFWWSVLQPRAKPDARGLASLFTTMLHTGALGALLTFSPRAWYAVYDGTERFGLSRVEDQQLGGLVMWVPGSLAYLIAGLAIAGAYLLSGSASPRRRSEAQSA